MGTIIYKFEGELHALVRITDFRFWGTVIPSSPKSYVSTAFVKNQIGPHGVWRTVADSPVAYQEPDEENGLLLLVEFNKLQLPFQFVVPVQNDSKALVLGADFLRIFKAEHQVAKPRPITSEKVDKILSTERPRSPEAPQAQETEVVNEESPKFLADGRRVVPLHALKDQDISLGFRLAILQKIRELEILQCTTKRRHRATIWYGDQRAGIDMSVTAETRIFL